MNEVNELKEFCQKNFIPFWYHEKDGEHYLNFGVDKHLRLFCGFWHFLENEFVNDILLQYSHFPEGNMIRVVCLKDKISSILDFFRSPIFALDVSLFSIFETILEKFDREGVSASFLNGCRGCSYLLNLGSYDENFEDKYLKIIRNHRLHNQKDCFGFADMKSLNLYRKVIYSKKNKRLPFLFQRILKK